MALATGHNAFNKIYPLYQRPRFTALSAYSIFLEVTVETGFLGLACFLWLLIVTFSIGLQQIARWRQSRNITGFWLIGAIAALLGLLAHGTVDTVWFRPEINSLWWLIVALVASCWQPSRNEPRQNLELATN